MEYVDDHGNVIDLSDTLSALALDSSIHVNDILPTAVAGGDLNLVQHLLENGADVNLKYNEHDTPLDSARYCRAKDAYNIYKLLLEKGADCNESDTTLNALAWQSLPIIQLMIDNGADISKVAEDGNMALHYVVMNPHLDVVEFLLDHADFDIDCKGAAGFSALHFVASEGSPDVCELLLRRGAAVDATTDLGDTALTLAVQRTDFEVSRIVEVLLEYGASLTDEHWGWNVLGIAAESECSIQTMNYLVRHVARLQCLNLNVCQTVLKAVETSNFYNGFYQQCLLELEQAEGTKFYNNVSIFNILMSSDKVISGYARNQELVQALQERDYDHVFPIYFSWLKKRFYAAVEEQRLQKFAAISLSNIFGLGDPFHPVIQKILSFMSAEDFKYLKI